MQRICKHCGYEGDAKRILRGSRGMEIFIWTVLLVPGPFYSLWRRVPAIRRCPHCHREGGMVSLMSDAGKIIRYEFENAPLPVLPRPTDNQ